jgi:ABC-type multidrug transport system fused ATPase/permease subunit
MSPTSFIFSSITLLLPCDYLFVALEDSFSYFPSLTDVKIQISENKRGSNSAHTSTATMESIPAEDSAAPSLILAEEEVSTGRAKAQPHTLLSMPHGAVEADAFDTTRPDWSFAQHLARQLEQGDTYGQLPKASKTSLLFENLEVFGLGAGATYQNTVGTGLQTPITALKKLMRYVKNPEKTILHGIDGVVREGQMLLVLGRPGSGCTTLLKSLAGFTEEYHRWNGSVRYNGVDISIVKERFRGDIAYNPEGKTGSKTIKLD